nr:MAG TPA: hypothetical protein [Caudoviricetes sp.]
MFFIYFPSKATLTVLIKSSLKAWFPQAFDFQ